MTVLEPYTAYMDDSGTEPSPHARLVTAALCASPVRMWKKFEKEWIAAEERYEFQNFHMTEFAGCNETKWCRDCLAGLTTEEQHPWRKWSQDKRDEVLAELLRIICKYTKQGFGLAFTKAEIDKHILNNEQLQALAPGAFGEEHYTFAASACGGELAKWRRRIGQRHPLKIVIDGEYKLELARLFLAENQSKPRFTDNGLENWFNLSGSGVAFESRKLTRQLLAADMLAWVTTKVRIAELFPKTYIKMGGWGKEVTTVAYKFVDSKNIHVGFNPESSIQEWLSRELMFWEQRRDAQSEVGIRDVRSGDDEDIDQEPSGVESGDGGGEKSKKAEA